MVIITEWIMSLEKKNLKILLLLNTSLLSTLKVLNILPILPILVLIVDSKTNILYAQYIRINRSWIFLLSPEI